MGWRDPANLAPDRQDTDRHPLQYGSGYKICKAVARSAIFQQDRRRTIEIKSFTTEISLEVGKEMLNFNPS